MNYKKAIEKKVQEEERISKGFVLLKKGGVIEAPVPPTTWTTPVISKLTFDDLRDDSIRIDLSKKIESICKEFQDETLLYDFTLFLETDNIFPHVWNILDPAIDIKVDELEPDSDSISETDEVYEEFNF